MGKIDVSEYIISKPLTTLPVSRVGRQVRTGRLSGEFIPSMPFWWVIAAAKAGTQRRITGYVHCRTGVVATANDAKVTNVACSRVRVEEYRT